VVNIHMVQTVTEGRWKPHQDKCTEIGNVWNYYGICLSYYWVCSGTVGCGIVLQAGGMGSYEFFIDL